MVAEQVAAAAQERGGRVVADDELTDIVNFLVEWPTVITGSFHERYLDLPREVIVTALREHQRFFAVERADGTLLPCFLTVRNGDATGLDTVRKGNEDVLVARLDDARFYWDTDLKHKPSELVEKLSGVVWMEGLGSLRDKASRLESLAGWLGERLAPEARAAATRAALLCKTDLLGEMIGSGKEYASLEGVMGGHYARRAGEPEEVAAAIAEHYLPRGAGDQPPFSVAGALLALADKLDHVAGAFVAGKSPSGSEDPYGVRRAANGALRIVIERGWRWTCARRRWRSRARSSPPTPTCRRRRS
jgi:glycyl-tRNA synthetase beta chain